MLLSCVCVRARVKPGLVFCASGNGDVGRRKESGCFLPWVAGKWWWTVGGKGEFDLDGCCDPLLAGLLFVCFRDLEGIRDESNTL